MTIIHQPLICLLNAPFVSIENIFCNFWYWIWQITKINEKSLCDKWKIRQERWKSFYNIFHPILYTYILYYFMVLTLVQLPLYYHHLLQTPHHLCGPSTTITTISSSLPLPLPPLLSHCRRRHNHHTTTPTSQFPTLCMATLGLHHSLLSFLFYFFLLLFRSHGPIWVLENG